MEVVTVEKMFRERKEIFELTLLTNENGLKKRILNSEIHRPGLSLAGFTERFANKRTQVLGETEMSFISGREGLAKMLLFPKALGPHSILPWNQPTILFSERSFATFLISSFLE